MKIDEMKNLFVELLLVRADADEGGEIKLNEKLLVENGLSGDTFWDVVCPSLKQEGLLKSYSNPSDPLSEYHLAVLNNNEVHAVFENLHLLTEKKIKDTEKRRGEIATELRNNFLHKFVVSKDKLSKWIVADDSQSLFVFTLTKNGVLSRSNPLSTDMLYKMDVGELPYKILEELIEAQSKGDIFYDTNDLAEFLNVKPAQVRKSVGGIKTRTVEMFSGLRKDDFIESSKNSGYRLNKKIRIIKV